MEVTAIGSSSTCSLANSFQNSLQLPASRGRSPPLKTGPTTNNQYVENSKVLCKQRIIPGAPVLDFQVQSVRNQSFQLMK